MNNVNLVGRLTADPKLVDQGERQICEMRIAIDNGRYQTTFIGVRVFGEHAYACAEYLYKGRRVGVSGKLAYDEWKDADGTRRERYSVIGRVEFLDRPSESERQKAAAGSGGPEPAGAALEPEDAERSRAGELLPA